MDVFRLTHITHDNAQHVAAESGCDEDDVLAVIRDELFTQLGDVEELLPETRAFGTLWDLTTVTLRVFHTVNGRAHVAAALCFVDKHGGKFISDTEFEAKCT